MKEFIEFREDLLYFVWKNKYFDHTNLTSIDGQRISIIDYGFQNSFSGPDFSNAKILIGDTIWAGNVEMHINSSDWLKHNHQHDASYQNVVLHVVLNHDKDIIFFSYQEKEINIPTLELAHRIPDTILKNYASLIKSSNWIPCEKLIRHFDKSAFEFWKYSIAIERLEQKTNYLRLLYEEASDDWEKVMFIVLSRYFGAIANSIAFETLARSFDYNILRKNINQHVKIEALLFGQAGFLSETMTDHYGKLLQNEYNFLKAKYHLKPLDKKIWKFSGVLPSGFPTLRIAQLAAFLTQNPVIFSHCIQSKKLDDIYAFFKVSPDDYWLKHYTFRESSNLKVVNLSQSFVDKLIINALIPVMFLYGKLSGKDDISETAVDMLSQMKAEKNSTIKYWQTLGFSTKTALDTQSLIHLKKNYCDRTQCLSCTFGRQVLLDK